MALAAAALQAPDHAPGRALGGAAWALLALAGAALPLGCSISAAWIAAPAGVAVLAAVLSHCRGSWRQGAAAGLVFGSAWLLASVWWLFISLHRYGGLPAPLAALAVLLLCLALSLYLAAACGAWVRLRRGRLAPDALLLAALWTLAEWARAELFTGFPWAASGYTQVDAPLAVLAPFTGVHGMGAMVALVGALVGLGAAAGGRRAAAMVAAAGLILAGAAAVPALDFTRSAGVQRLTLLQPNVPQELKFADDHMVQHLTWLARALDGTPSGLVVAPETAVPLLPQQLSDLAPGWWDDLQDRLRRQGKTALLGLPLGSYEAGYTNSVVAVGGPTPLPYRYDKQHLVPFGEFIPPGFRWFTQMMDIPLGDFARGPLSAPSLAFGRQRLAPNICYEDLFGDELAARFVEPSRAPTALVNFSNIGWFGDTIAVQQHLNISRLRALELQRPMLRATNTGATAIIDHRGRVTHRLSAFTRGVLDGEFDGRDGVTPFARWAGPWGLWPVFALALLVAAVTARWPSPRSANAKAAP